MRGVQLLLLLLAMTLTLGADPEESPDPVALEKEFKLFQQMLKTGRQRVKPSWRQLWDEETPPPATPRDGSASAAPMRLEDQEDRASEADSAHHERQPAWSGGETSAFTAESSEESPAERRNLQDDHSKQGPTQGIREEAAAAAAGGDIAGLGEESAGLGDDHRVEIGRAEETGGEGAAQGARAAGQETPRNHQFAGEGLAGQAGEEGRTGSAEGDQSDEDEAAREAVEEAAAKQREEEEEAARRAAEEEEEAARRAAEEEEEAMRRAAEEEEEAMRRAAEEEEAARRAAEEAEAARRAAEEAARREAMIRNCERQSPVEFSLALGSTMTPASHLSRCQKVGPRQCVCAYLLMEKNGNLVTAIGEKTLTPSVKAIPEGNVKWTTDLDADILVKDGRFVLSLERCTGSDNGLQFATYCATVRRKAAQAGGRMQLIWQSEAGKPNPAAEQAQDLPPVVPGVPALLLTREADVQIISGSGELLWSSAFASATEEDQVDESTVSESAATGAPAILMEIRSRIALLIQAVHTASASFMKRRERVCERAGRMGDDSDFFLALYDNLIKYRICPSGIQEDDDQSGSKGFPGGPLPGQTVREEGPSMVSSGQSGVGGGAAGGMGRSMGGF
eukprot:scaffold8_cov249-Pinguiococcus_pyrenoidosus.AAC.14